MRSVYATKPENRTMMKKLSVILAAIGIAVAYSSCETTSGDRDRGSNEHSGGHKHYNPLR